MQKNITISVIKVGSVLVCFTNGMIVVSVDFDLRAYGIVLIRIERKMKWIQVWNFYNDQVKICWDGLKI